MSSGVCRKEGYLLRIAVSRAFGDTGSNPILESQCSSVNATDYSESRESNIGNSLASGLGACSEMQEGL